MGNVVSAGKKLIRCGADPVDPPKDLNVSDQPRHEQLNNRRSTSPSVPPRTASLVSSSSSQIREDLRTESGTSVPASAIVETKSAAYTTCGTVEARKDVYRDVPEWESPDALRHDVEAYVRDQLLAAKAAGKKAVVIVGEHHRSITSLLVQMVAVATVHRSHAQGPVMMLEDEPPKVRRFVADITKRLDSAMPEHAEGDSANEANKFFEDKLRRSPTAAAQRAWNQAFSVYLAQRLGFEITGFDTRRPLPHEDSLSAPRELGMVGAIRDQFSTGDAPTVVIAGRHHLPVLHEALTSEVHVIALAGVLDPQSTKNPVENERESYLFAHPDLMRFRADNTATEYGRFEFMQFAKELGIDLSRKPEATEQN